MFGILSAILYASRDAVVGLFTTEDAVLELARDVWAKVCWYNFNTSLFGVHFGIATGLGIQRTMGTVTMLVLWAGAFPFTYWRSFTGHGSLETVWNCLWTPYLTINVVMTLVLLFQDWDQKRQLLDEVGETSDDLRTSLLSGYASETNEGTV
jgi:Na+-driven multidrug efflux pump